jgi:hypothetical protein
MPRSLSPPERGVGCVGRGRMPYTGMVDSPIIIAR